MNFRTIEAMAWIGRKGLDERLITIFAQLKPWLGLGERLITLDSTARFHIMLWTYTLS